MTSLVRAAEQDRLTPAGPGRAQGAACSRRERQTRQLGRLVDRLLDVSRLSTQRPAARARARRTWRTSFATSSRGTKTRRPRRAARIELTSTATDGGRLGPEPPRSGRDEPASGTPSSTAPGAHHRVVDQRRHARACPAHRSRRGPGHPASSDQERIFGQFERAATRRASRNGARAVAGEAHRDRPRRHGDASTAVPDRARRSPSLLPTDVAKSDDGNEGTSAADDMSSMPRTRTEHILVVEDDKDLAGQTVRCA